MRILLAGGAVRNLLLGQPMADKDFLVLGADEAQFLRRFPGARQVGRRFPVYIAGGHEYAFLRADGLELDLAARDLTINALALDEDGELYCHPQALDDLLAHVLRPASPTAMADDPLRVYRAARFAASLPGFTAHPDLLAQMGALAHSQALGDLAPERVGQEVLKALAAPAPSAFLRLLARTGCLEPWLPELDNARIVPAGPGSHGDETVFAHTCDVLDRLPPEPLVRWMGLCHDLGKVATPRALWPAHVGHEAQGAETARLAARRLRLNNRLTLAGCLAAGCHMTAGNYDQLRPGTRVDLLTRLHAANLVREVFLVVSADKGVDHLPEAQEDLKRILDVHLAPEDRGDGPESGEKLRLLRAQTLSRKRRLPL